VASVDPCGFALLPSLLSYYLGSDTAERRGVLRIADGLTVGLVLTAGFWSSLVPRACSSRLVCTLSSGPFLACRWWWDFS
jgi:cytochrome c biogenesis protein CcdA